MAEAPDTLELAGQSWVSAPPISARLAQERRCCIGPVHRGAVEAVDFEKGIVWIKWIGTLKLRQGDRRDIRQE